MQINKNKFEPVSIQSVISAEDKKDKAQPIDEKRRDETSREKEKLFQVKFQNYTQIYIKIYLNIRNIIIMNFKTKIEIFIFWLSNKLYHGRGQNLPVILDCYFLSWRWYELIWGPVVQALRIGD